jgi:type I restriction enzyme S subunit
MDLAVRGRFDRVRLPDVEGDKTLGMIGEECKRLATAAGTRSHDVPTLTEGETPFHLPDAWRWVRLGSICYQITDGTHQTPHYVNSGVPFLSVKDVTGGTLDFSKVRFISPDEHAALSRRCKPQRDDILFTKVGTTGVARVVDTDREFSIFVSLALLKFPTKYIDPAFLCLVLNSPFVRQQSARNTQGIGNKNLVLRFIRECVVAIPPPSIQADVLAKVDALLKLCDDLEAKLKAKEATAGKLVEAVVRELVA